MSEVVRADHFDIRNGYDADLPFHDCVDRLQGSVEIGGVQNADDRDHVARRTDQPIALPGTVLAAATLRLQDRIAMDAGTVEGIGQTLQDRPFNDDLDALFLWSCMVRSLSWMAGQVTAPAMAA
jgi:hypothetical protein